MTDDARLIQAWLELQENWWAHEALELLCDSDAERAWSVMTEVVEGALLARCARLLSLLYAGGLLLPDVEPECTDLEGASLPSPPVNHRLGTWDLYFDVFDPLKLTEPTTSSLADDLSDIYGALAPPLRAFYAGRYTDAIWSWRFSLRGITW